MVLCRKRNSIELTVRQPGIEAVKRSSRALWHLSNSCTVSRSCMYSSSCTHGPLPEAKLHRAGRAATKRFTAEQSGTDQPLSQSAKPDVHHTHTHMVLCRKRNSIELAVRQQGSEAAKRSTEQAAEQAAKEGSAVGLLRVLLKEHDHDNVQMVQLAAKPLLLQDLKVCVQRS